MQIDTYWIFRLYSVRITNSKPVCEREALKAGVFIQSSFIGNCRAVQRLEWKTEYILVKTSHVAGARPIPPTMFRGFADLQARAKSISRFNCSDWYLYSWLRYLLSWAPQKRLSVWCICENNTWTTILIAGRYCILSLVKIEFILW